MGWKTIGVTIVVILTVAGIFLSLFGLGGVLATDRQIIVATVVLTLIFLAGGLHGFYRRQRPETPYW